jgi:hypothetical protein
MWPPRGKSRSYTAIPTTVFTYRFPAEIGRQRVPLEYYKSGKKTAVFKETQLPEFTFITSIFNCPEIPSNIAERASFVK